MSEQAKTPALPWHAIPHSDPVTRCVSVAGAGVERYADGHITCWNVGGISAAETAERVVRAVNSHEELLAALKTVSSALDRLSIVTSHVPHVYETLTLAQEAIARAEGDTAHARSVRAVKAGVAEPKGE